MDKKTSDTSQREMRNEQALSTDHLSDDLVSRTAKGGVIGAVSQGMRMVVGMVTMAILARVLTPYDFGLVALATISTGAIALFADLGLSMATVQKRSLRQETVSTLFFVTLGVSVLAMAVLVLLSPFIAWIFNEPSVAPVIIAIAIQIPIIGASRQHTALLQRGMYWTSLEMISLASQGVAAVITVFLAIWSDLGYWVLVVQIWVAAGISLALTWRVCKWRPDLIFRWSAARDSIHFGTHITLFQFLNFFHRQSDDMLIGWRWGASDLGFYNRAYALLLAPIQLIQGPVTAAVIPGLSRLHGDSEAWSGLYVSTLKVVVTVAAPLSFMLILAAPELILIMFGPGWERSIGIFQILSICMIAQPVMSSTGWLWISADKTRKMLNWALCSIPVMVLAMVVCLPYGAEGVAVGYALSFLILTPLSTAYAASHLPISFWHVYRSIGPILGLAIVAFLLIAYGPMISGGAVFPSGLWGMVIKLFGYLFLYVVGILCLEPAMLIGPGRAVIARLKKDH
ncbi:lipopolysaccharide biosynthesis protein [Pseudophaeobacter sp. 1A16562]